MQGREQATHAGVRDRTPNGFLPFRSSETPASPGEGSPEGPRAEAVVLAVGASAVTEAGAGEPPAPTEIVSSGGSSSARVEAAVSQKLHREEEGPTSEEQESAPRRTGTGQLTDTALRDYLRSTRLTQTNWNTVNDAEREAIGFLSRALNTFVLLKALLSYSDDELVQRGRTTAPGMVAFLRRECARVEGEERCHAGSEELIEGSETGDRVVRFFARVLRKYVPVSCSSRGGPGISGSAGAPLEMFLRRGAESQLLKLLMLESVGAYVPQEGSAGAEVAFGLASGVMEAGTVRADSSFWL